MDNYWGRKEKGSGNYGSRGVWRQRSSSNRCIPMAGQRSDSVPMRSDSVPIWEKKFCESVCLIPWHRLLEGQRFMHLYENVMMWNDSAVEEAFKNAKGRFWAEMNGIPCKVDLPDPDIYIDKVDWDSDVDPELFLELERALEMNNKVSGPEVNSFMSNNEPVVCDQGWGDLDAVPLPAPAPVECGGWGDLDAVAVPAPAPVESGGWDTWDDDLIDNYGSNYDLKGNGYTGNSNGGGGWGQEGVNRSSGWDNGHYSSAGKNQCPPGTHWRGKEGDGLGLNRGFKNNSRGRRRQERPRWQDRNPSYGRW